MKYKEEHHGSTRPPRTHILGKQVSYLEIIKKKKKVSKVRADKLEGFRLVWTLNKSWDESLQS